MSPCIALNAMVCNLTFDIFAIRLPSFIRPSVVVFINIFGAKFWGSTSSDLMFLEVIFEPYNIFVLVGQ